jgi:hypothetical protein
MYEGQQEGFVARTRSRTGHLDSSETKFLGQLRLIISTNISVSGPTTHTLKMSAFLHTKIFENIRGSWQRSKLYHARILLALTDMSVTIWRHERKKLCRRTPTLLKFMISKRRSLPFEIASTISQGAASSNVGTPRSREERQAGWSCRWHERTQTAHEWQVAYPPPPKAMSV